MKSFELTGRHYIDLIKNSELPALIYGMGNGADKVIDLFNENDINILGVTASDDFVRGQIFRGFIVKKLSDYNGEFIITPAFGTSIENVMNHIIDLNKDYRLLYPAVPVCGDKIAGDSFFEKYSDKIDAAYELLSEKSKIIFIGYLEFIYTGELRYLLDITIEKDEIFRSFLNLDGIGTYIDVGAYKGDTVKEYLNYTKGIYDEIIAVEPDKKNYEKLKMYLDNYNNAFAVNKVCSDIIGRTGFISSGGRQSYISEKGAPTVTVTIDELSEGKNITYIKIDAEGEEQRLIKGAKNTIKRCKPKLNIALYHKFSDIFEIPLQIAELNPDYRFEIRHHPYFPAWDTNLYCV